MLGFNALSTEPLSSILSDIIRLESGGNLDSFSIIDPSSFINSFNSCDLLNYSYINTNTKSNIYNSLVFNNLSSLQSNNSLYIVQNKLFVNHAEVAFNTLNKVISPTSLEIYSKIELGNYIKYKLSQNIISHTDVFPFAILRNFNSVSPDIRTSLDINTKLWTGGGVDIGGESSILLNSLGRIIGNSLSSAYSNVDLNRFIRVFDNIQIENNSSFDIILSNRKEESIYFNSVGVLLANLSEVNRDIVYYILTINPEEPFNLYISRSK